MSTNTITFTTDEEVTYSGGRRINVNIGSTTVFSRTYSRYAAEGSDLKGITVDAFATVLAEVLTAHEEAEYA